MVSFLRKGRFYIRNLILVMNIQIILENTSSFSSTLFHLINLDLHCWISKLTRVLGHFLHIFWAFFGHSGTWALGDNLASSVLRKVIVLVLYGLIFTTLDYGFIWFNWTLQHKILLKNQPLSQWQLSFTLDLKLGTQVCTFRNGSAYSLTHSTAW